MKQAVKMDNGFLDFISDLGFTLISGVFLMLGLDSIPGGQPIIKVIMSPTAESGLDVTNKLMLLLSTIIACLSGGITIYKAIKGLYKKQK